MRLITYLSHGIPRLGAWIDPYVLDIEGAVSLVLSETGRDEIIATTCQSMLSLLQSGDETWEILHSVVKKVSQDAEKAGKEWVDLGILMPKGEAQLLAPLLTPGKVICVAGNYSSPGINQKPDYPIIFLKPSSSITGPGMAIWLTDMTRNVAIEVELALVIYKTAKHINRDDALSCVAGYILANDICDRDLEKRTSQWTSGKMFDSFTPMGPWLVTKDEIPDPNDLQMTSLVNGVAVQKGNTSQMVFNCAQLISILSDLTTLVPGDVILTGSTKCMDGKPNPTIALIPGDTITIKIESLGELTNPVMKE
ncbi:MAG: fumarylacetoacetate hydrolase family protein [Anaerolineaceae bacterium]|nr:fumarylacetoacetate hydrolase family protein [Anaerolineaceae bacterium]